MNTSIENGDRTDSDKTSLALEDQALADVNGGSLDDVFRFATDIARRVVPPLVHKASDALRAEGPVATRPMTDSTT